MSLVRPTAIPIKPFDAKNFQTFKFAVNGGDQVVKNRITIRNNITNEIKYQKTAETFALEQTVPNNALQNGVEYNVSFNTINIKGNISYPSYPIIFYCFTEGKIEFDNIEDETIVTNSYYDFEATYSQREGEPLESCQLILYDANRNIISKSEKIYPSNDKIKYTIKGFDGDKTYFVEIVGITEHGMNVKSSQVKFHTSLYQPSLYSILKLTNNCKEGYIEISNNIKVIDGITNMRPPIYIDKKRIDLLDNRYVEWNEGFEINGDFALTLWCSNVEKDSTIITMKNDNLGIIKINIIEEVYGENKGKYIAELYCIDDDLSMYICSNPITTLNNFVLSFRKIDDMWQIRLEELS